MTAITTSVLASLSSFILVRYKWDQQVNETLDGHPLFRSGLEYYSAHVAENSPWIEEQKSIDSVRRRYREEHWARYVHYLLAFHDEIYECIATGFKTEETNESLTAAVSRLAATAVT